MVADIFLSLTQPNTGYLTFNSIVGDCLLEIPNPLSWANDCSLKPQGQLTLEIFTERASALVSHGVAQMQSYVGKSWSFTAHYCLHVTASTWC